ncbi:type VI secretion system ImpA family N-terminal domain-containing protein [Vibrio sagamiensis]|nr:type VI secretion system ImpA family N-terminal domain-containing protein [Vibrio sagamiensis]
MFFSDFTRRPIDESNPSGVNPNGLEDFDEIKRQINTLNKVTGQVSWKTVQSLSKKILSTQGKDFRCSCYFTVAALHIDGLKGLVEGLNSILDLCVVYWYNASPEHTKPNTRISAIEWMVEHTERRIKKYRIQPDELPLIEAAHQLCLRIEEELRLHYGIKSPSFGRIRRVIKPWIEELKEAQIKAQEPQITSRKIEKEQPRPKQGIQVDVASSLSTSKRKESESLVETQTQDVPLKSNKGVIFIILALILAAFASHFVHKQYQHEKLISQIEQASIPQLAVIVDSFKTELSEEQIQSLRSVTIEKLDSLMTNWPNDPVKVTYTDNIDKLTSELSSIYSDSSSVQQLRSNFLVQRSQFETDYDAIYKQFSYARTTFANVLKKNSTKSTKKAYEYSNSLFPLLGRIEYTENNQEQQELERSAYLLNVYLYKLTQLKDKQTKIIK